MRSDPYSLAKYGYEYSDRPLPDYVIKNPFPYIERYPETETEPEPIAIETAEQAALAHAERGDPGRAAALLDYTGNAKAAEYARGQSKWL